MTNGRALVNRVLNSERDTVFIPAGNVADPDFSAQEDWVAAAAIATQVEIEIGEGATAFREWRHMISMDGVAKLFETAPHADALRAIGLEEDIAFCARPNLTTAVPSASAQTAFGIQLTNIE